MAAVRRWALPQVLIRTSLAAVLMSAVLPAPALAQPHRFERLVSRSVEALRASAAGHKAAETFLEALKKAGWVDDTSSLRAAVAGIHLPTELPEAEQQKQDAAMLQACDTYEKAIAAVRLGKVAELLDGVDEGGYDDPLDAAQIALLAKEWGYTRFDGLRELPWQLLADALRRDLFSKRDDALVREAIALVRRNCQKP